MVMVETVHVIASDPGPISFGAPQKIIWPDHPYWKEHPDELKRELAVMNPWQPIETAPKGPQILIYDGKSIGIAAWEVISKSGTGWWRYQAGPNEAPFGDYDPPPVCDKPTHWMPLPEPPK